MWHTALRVVALVALLLSGASAKNTRYIVTQRPSTRTTQSGGCNTAADVLGKNSATTFLKAVKAARFEPVLSDPANQLKGALFVPTNAAFADLARQLGLSVPQLLANVPLITEIVRYHFVQDEVRRLSDVGDGEILQTALGDAASCGVSVIRLRVDGIQTFIDQASNPANPAGVVKPNLRTCNGFGLHVIDKVLLSCPIATLRQLFLGQAAPALQLPAFTTQLQQGFPQPVPIVLQQAQQGQCQSPLQAIQQLQQEGINVQGFQLFLQVTNLVEAFSDPQANATIFVPTDEAIQAALTANGLTFDQLAQNVNVVQDILFYHVVPSPVGGAALDSTQLTEGAVLQTSLTAPLALTCGVSTLTITRPNNGLVVLGAQGTSGNSGTAAAPADRRSCASVIHVIDALLLPCPLGGTQQQPTPGQPQPVPQPAPVPAQPTPVPQPTPTQVVPPVPTDASGAFQLAFGDAFARSEANSPNVAEAESDATAPRTAFSEAFATGGQAARSVARANGGERAVAKSVAVAGQAGGRKLLLL
ncbi:hypothetical protein BSKO_03061 [Bryopsis sp. KO-2023]|nr:hypothetical protein BSKO_03061 [Bryopsis sp. KO-2023]